MPVMNRERLRDAFRSVARLNRRWRMLTIRKLLYLPRILSVQEKRLLLFLLLVALLSGGILMKRAYVALTRLVPQTGGSYIEGIIGSPRMINPIYAVKDADRDLTRLMFSGLLMYDGSGAAHPDLAERYDVSPDGKVYTVVLREGLLWHDGARLTADDVVFTVKRIQNAQYKSPLRLNWQGVDTERIDSRTIRFTLRSAYAPFIENLAQGIIPKHLWEQVDPGQAFLHALNLNPVGSGPYRLKRFKYDRDGSLLWYSVTRNPRFHRMGPYLKEITLMFFKNEDGMIAAWRRGDIEGFGPVSSSRVREFSPDAVRVASLATPRIFSVFFNARQAPALADKSMRRAFSYAIDKKRIAEQATTGGGIAVYGVLPVRDLPTGTIIAEKTEMPTAGTYDRARAREMIESAGWKDADRDGVYEKTLRDGKKTRTVPLELSLSTGDSPELLRAASLLQEMLAEAGVRVTIEGHSFADLESSVIRPRNFQLLLFGQVHGYEPDPFAFWHSSQIKDPGLNVAFFAHKQADRLLEEARRTTDEAKRAARYGDFSRIIAQEIPAIPIYTQLYQYLLPRDMEGVALSRISLPSDRFNDINAWYRKTKRVFF